jgi:hypothetical protein
MRCKPALAATALVATLLLNMVFMGWGSLDTVFVDTSHPAEYRLGSVTLFLLFAGSTLIMGGFAAALFALAERFPHDLRQVVVAVVFTACWIQGALGIAGWMVSTEGGTWLWYEPFAELFWHPIITPGLFLGGVATALRVTSRP